MKYFLPQRCIARQFAAAHRLVGLLCEGRPCGGGVSAGSPVVVAAPEPPGAAHLLSLNAKNWTRSVEPAKAKK